MTNVFQLHSEPKAVPVEVFFVAGSTDAQIEEDEGWYFWPQRGDEPQGPYATQHEATFEAAGKRISLAS